MLPDDEIQRYKRELQQQQEKVNEEIEALTAWCDPVAPDVALGRLTRNDAMQDQQMALHQRERLRTHRARIEAALNRIAKGLFGICPACKTPIDKRRLDMAPDSALCVPCLEKYRARNPGR